MGLPGKNISEQNHNMYDQYYQKPDWWFSFRYDTQVKKKTCLFLLKKAGFDLKNLRVLEIGFGSGATIFSFDKSCEIHGVEISDSAIKRAQKRAMEKGFIKYSFTLSGGNKFSFPDGFFDIVIASHVLEHIENDAWLLSEINRMLSPKGVSIILIPINENYLDPNHVRRYTSKQLSELAFGCGLKSNYLVENELLFHLVEKFYFEKYNYKWKRIGPLIALLFNFPTSILPFPILRAFDWVFTKLHYKPRQTGFVFSKKDSL